MKGNIAVLAEAIAALDKKAAAALVEKRELWSTLTTIQSDITTALARASYLEKEGFEVDPNHMGSLVKMHYKLHSYVTYKIKKGKKYIKKRKTFDKHYHCKCQNDVHHKKNEAKTTTSIH